MNVLYAVSGSGSDSSDHQHHQSGTEVWIGPICHTWLDTEFVTQILDFQGWLLPYLNQSCPPQSPPDIQRLCTMWLSSFSHYIFSTVMYLDRHECKLQPDCFTHIWKQLFWVSVCSGPSSVKLCDWSLRSPLKQLRIVDIQNHSVGTYAWLWSQMKI